MKVKDIKEMTVAETNKKLEEARESLFKLNVRRKSSRVEKPHEIKALKKDIARMKTILKQKEVKA